MYKIINSTIILIIITIDKISAKLNDIFCEKCDFPQKDLHRSSNNTCPCCFSTQVTLADKIPYFKTHLRKWNTGFFSYHRMISSDLRYVYFDINICSDCMFIYVPDSYSGLVENVERHNIYQSKSIKNYLENVHLVMTKRKFEKIVKYNLRDLDIVEQRYKLVSEILKKYINDECNYLDIGSNYGTYAEFVRLLFPNIHVTGVEINDSFVISSRENYPDLNVISADICNIAIGKYDFIYCSDVIEHIWDIDAFVDGIVSSCTDNALVLLITPNADSPEARLQGKEWWSFIVPHHAQIFGIRSLDKLMGRKGFKPMASGVIGQELWAIYRLSVSGDSAVLAQLVTEPLHEFQE